MRLLFVAAILVVALAVAITLYFFFAPVSSSNKTPVSAQNISKPAVPAPNPQWASVLGYTESFNQCRKLCQNYQQRCDNQSALSYCSAIVSIDLNRNGKIDAKEFGSSPAATENCETNARCYDTIPSCSCVNQSLTISACMSLLYQNYINAGLDESQALQNLAQNTASNCSPPQT